MRLDVQGFVFLSFFTFINSSDICDSYDTYLNIFEDQSKCEQHDFPCVFPARAKRVYIFGGSGVGKSTFINVMTGNFVQTDECCVIPVQGNKGFAKYATDVKWHWTKIWL